MYKRICEEYEPEHISKKFSEDILVTLDAQFDCGNIIDDSLEMVEDHFQIEKSLYFEAHPIEELT